jgi:hypothetical protein
MILGTKTRSEQKALHKHEGTGSKERPLRIYLALHKIGQRKKA